MEYKDVEKQFLALLDRTNFKNLSKNDVITYASKLNELRPEVAMQVVAQYPELVKLIQSVMIECKEMLEKVIESDDASINRVYDTTDKVISNDDESRNLFFNLANKVLSDCGKCLENPNLTFKEQKEIRDQEMEVLHMYYEKDKEIRDQDMEIVKTVDKKDSEKRGFNWKLIGTICVSLIAITGVGGAVLGGNFNLKLPKK